MLGQEAFQYLLVAVSSFAEHPSNGFVNEVVRMVEKLFREPKDVIEIVLLDEVKASNHTDAFTPKVP